MTGENKETPPFGGENNAFRVLAQARRCLENVVDGRGGRGRYLLVEGTFRLTERTTEPDGAVRYGFTAEAYYESQDPIDYDDFYDGDGADRDSRGIAGHITLDRDFRLTREANGRVRFGPWPCLDPDAIQ